MLKNYFAFSFLLLISINIFSQDAISEDFIDRCNHENCYKDQIEKIISLILPEGSKIESIEKSEFPGVYKVYFGDLQPLYVSEDGRYFLYGQMFKIDLQTASVGADLYGSYKSLEPSVKNLTDMDMFEKRRSLMKEIQESELITFKSINENPARTPLFIASRTPCSNASAKSVGNSSSDKLFSNSKPPPASSGSR